MKRSSTRTDAAVLVAALFVLVSSLAVSSYRLTLPSDGWSVGLFVGEEGGRLVFVENLGAVEDSPLLAGDALLAVEGQPVEDVLGRALVLDPRRPAGWEAGNTVRYTVARDGETVTLDVPLARRPVSSAAGSLVSNPFRFAGTLGVLLIGLYVFFRRPGQPASRLLLLWGACFASYEVSRSVSGERAGPAEMLYAGAYWPTELFDTLIWLLVLNPIFPHLFMVFPVVKGPMRRHPAATLAGIYGLMPGVVAAVLAASYDEPFAFWSAYYGVISAQFVLAVGVVGVAAAHTFATLRDPVGRARLRWLSFGFAAGMGSAGVAFFLTRVYGEGPLLSALVTFGGVLLPVSLAVAILRYRLLDIDVIINRTLVYGALTAALVLVYGGSVVILQYAFRSVSGGESQLAVVASTLAIAALFNPLRRRVQAFVDSRFYKSKYDAALTLSSFSTKLREETDLDALRGEVVEVVRTTVAPEHVSLYLRSGVARGGEDGAELEVNQAGTDP